MLLMVLILDGNSEHVADAYISELPSTISTTVRALCSAYLVVVTVGTVNGGPDPPLVLETKYKKVYYQ